MPDALTGCGIAITRPIDQAQPLADLVRQEGGTPVLFPLLAISPLEDTTTFDAVIESLPQYDWAIFISSNAVEQGMPAVRARHPQLPDSLRFAAIGPSTAAALQAFGVGQVLTPASRFDSESLLTLPDMHAMEGKRVMIFRGVGGRELLAETLSARGASVVFAECYRRTNPQRDAGELTRLWQNNQLHALVVTSSEALRNLIALAGDADWLRHTPICVNHERIAIQAREHGLQAALATTPGDTGMLNCLIRNRKQS